MTPAEKLTTIAENERKVYEAGKQAEYDRFWDGYQQSGNRTDYKFAFYGVAWTDETFKPKHPITPTGNYTEGMFLNSLISETEIDIDFSQCTTLAMTFRDSHIKKIKLVDGSNVNATSSGLYWTFSSEYLESVELITNENARYDNTFQGCSALQELTMGGVIAKAINFQWSPLLTDTSVQSIIDHLKDLTGATAQTLTFHADVGAKLTDEQKAAIAAKNWTLVY